MVSFFGWHFWTTFWHLIFDLFWHFCHFLTIFLILLRSGGSFLDRFLVIFLSFFGHFLVIFWSFLVVFDTFLTPFFTTFWHLFGTFRTFLAVFLESRFWKGVDFDPIFAILDPRMSFFVKNDVFSKNVIFGIFCHFLTFFHFLKFDPMNCSWFFVHFSVFSKNAIFCKNGHFLGGVRGPPYSFLRFLTFFCTSAHQKYRFFSRFFTFLNYPRSPGAIQAWILQKRTFLKCRQKHVHFWMSDFGRTTHVSFLSILSDFGSIFDPPFSVFHFFLLLLRAVHANSHFFVEKNAIFFRVFWRFLTIF